MNSKTWGNPELDRLWMEAYAAELELDDLDLVTESPRLLKAQMAIQAFRNKLEALEQKRRMGESL